MIDPVSLGAALAARSTSQNDTQKITGAPPIAGAGSFMDMVARAGANVVHQLENSETTAIRGIQGDAGPRQVADAVMDAEQALTAAIAIRDKIVSAYLEISRMTI